jgi:serine/threonine-protein kinase
VVVALAITAIAVPAIRREATAPPPSPTDSVASVGLGVMPFENLSGSPADEPFSDGLSEELIDALGRVPGLRVAARTSSFALRGRNLGLEEIGRLLNVQAIVTGTVRRSADQLRVTVRLEEVATRSLLWSERYDRSAGEVFAIQEGIARAVATRLAGTLAPGLDERLVIRETPSLEAHELVLRGRYLLNNRGADADSALPQALSNFDRALVLDSNYAAAAAGLAETYAIVGNFHLRPRAEAYRLAVAAAHRAIAIDSTDPDALKALGYVAVTAQRDYTGAEAALLKALSVSPYDAWTRHYYALLLTVLGRYDEAVRESGISRQMDPTGSRSQTLRAVLSHVPGHAVDMRQDLTDLLARQPNYPWALYTLGLQELVDGRFTAAVTHLERALAAVPGLPGAQGLLAVAYVRAGRAAEAERVSRNLESAPPGQRRPFDRAILHSAQGELDLAFARLAEAEWDIPALVDLRTNPFLAPMRVDPRYPALLRTLGLQP